MHAKERWSSLSIYATNSMICLAQTFNMLYLLAFVVYFREVYLALPVLKHGFDRSNPRHIVLVAFAHQLLLYFEFELLDPLLLCIDYNWIEGCGLLTCCAETAQDQQLCLAN